MANKERAARQSFLGQYSQEQIEEITVGVVGLGGGGSHIVQQLAHIGFKNYVIFDPDIPEESNLNRLIGAKTKDVPKQYPKIMIADRMINGLVSKATVKKYKCRWQDEPAPLRTCDLIFSCLDGFAARREIEVFTRRYMIALVDIGMDVHQIDGEPPRISGQVILSIPNNLCMTCLGFLNETNLAKEAALYGNAGSHPQVVWSNGVLASIAVGVGIELITNWTESKRPSIYLSYDGNRGTVTPHKRLQYLTETECTHFSNQNLGDPIFTQL